MLVHPDKFVHRDIGPNVEETDEVLKDVGITMISIHAEMTAVEAGAAEAKNHLCKNTTVTASVRSNPVTILGRTAAYRRAEVTWDKMLRQNEKWTADLKGLKP